MNTCCRDHEDCAGCRNIAACVNLWARACEQSFTRSLTSEQLQNYVEEFNLFLSERRRDCQSVYSRMESILPEALPTQRKH